MPHFVGSRLTDGDKVVNLTRGPLCTPQTQFSVSGTHFC
jgi:hypothetical protein